MRLKRLNLNLLHHAGVILYLNEPDFATMYAKLPNSLSTMVNIHRPSTGLNVNGIDTLKV